MFHKSLIAQCMLSICVVLLLFLIYDSIKNDKMHEYKLNHDNSLWEISELSKPEQIAVNKMIDNYFTRKSLNKSRYKRLIHSARGGAIRGAVGGCIMSGPSGIIPGAILYSILGAVNTGVYTKMPSNKNII